MHRTAPTLFRIDGPLPAKQWPCGRLAVGGSLHAVCGRRFHPRVVSLKSLTCTATGTASAPDLAQLSQPDALAAATTAPLPTALKVAPAEGFAPNWKGPLIAAVVIVSFIISLLLFISTASFRRQRLLLNETVVRPASWGVEKTAWKPGDRERPEPSEREDPGG